MSVTRALLPFAGDAVRGILRRLKKNQGPGTEPNQRPPKPIAPSITAYELRAKLGAERFDQYYSFAFVRNPWDWQVSLYEYIRTQPNHPEHVIVSRFAGFSEYLRWRCGGVIELQKGFVTDPGGQQLVNFVGRYERITQDFARVCAQLQIDARLPHLNRTPRRPYTEYYTEETRSLVASCYRADIEYFNYSYD